MNLKSRIHGCWLGKSIGGTLGLPAEGRMERLNFSFYDPVPTIAPHGGLPDANPPANVQSVRGKISATRSGFDAQSGGQTQRGLGLVKRQECPGLQSDGGSHMQQIQRPLAGLFCREFIGKAVNIRVVDRPVNQEPIPKIGVDFGENPIRVRDLELLPMQALPDRVSQFHPIEWGEENVRGRFGHEPPGSPVMPVDIKIEGGQKTCICVIHGRLILKLPMALVADFPQDALGQARPGGRPAPSGADFRLGPLCRYQRRKRQQGDRLVPLGDRHGLARLNPSLDFRKILPEVANRGRFHVKQDDSRELACQGAGESARADRLRGLLPTSDKTLRFTLCSTQTLPTLSQLNQI
jgi:hypothetical protein